MSVYWKGWTELVNPYIKGNPKASKMEVHSEEKAKNATVEGNDVATRLGTFEDGVTLELGDGFCREKSVVSKDMLLESKAAARTLKVGSRGDDVRQLQQNLNTLGYNAGKPDGIFGNGTKNEVIRFQKTYGLSADGIAGKNTLDAIATTVRRKNNGILSKGQVSAEVKSLQNNLKNLGYLKGTADGAFGSGTEAAVKAFQKAHGMTPDGLVGGGTKAQISKAIQEKEDRESSVLKVGSRGDKVRTLQSNLNALGYNAGTPDGQFGSGTQNEVIRFQKTYGLTADGQAGPNTQEAISKALNNKNKGVLSKGQFSNDVKSLQSDLKTLGYLSGSADGAFGSGTEAAVKAFQKAHNLTQDGLVGSTTRAKITAAVREKEEAANSVLRIGSQGDAVKKLQKNLNSLGYNAGTPDGQFGGGTQTEVIRFQKTYGLSADGQAGPNTQQAIAKALNYKNNGVLSKGQVSDEVAHLQQNLKKLGLLSGTVDGAFGAGTEAAVKAFQKKYGLTEDGLAGKSTREKIATAVTNQVQPSNRVLKVGSAGDDVKTLQESLKRIGYKISDVAGSFGESTASAVKIFQRAFDLTPDGQVGKYTQNALASALKHANNNKISRGFYGDAVEKLQKTLKDAGYFVGEITKVFDNATITAYAKCKDDMSRKESGTLAGATELLVVSLEEELAKVELYGAPLFMPETGTEIEVSFGVDIPEKNEVLKIKGTDACPVEFSRNNVGAYSTEINRRLNILDDNFQNNMNEHNLLTYKIGGRACYAGMMVDGFGKVGDIVELTFDDNSKANMILVDTQSITHTSKELEENKWKDISEVQCEYGHGYKKEKENMVQLAPCEFLVTDRIGKNEGSATNYKNGEIFKNKRLKTAVVVDSIDL